MKNKASAEAALCAAMKKGDANALGRIIEMYSAYVCTVARNFSGGSLSAEDIDEISADVFYGLWKRRDDVNAENGVRAYLSAAVRNAVIDRLRKKPPVYEDISRMDIPCGTPVEEAAETGEMMRCLSEALDALPRDEREIFFRSYFYGEKCSLIAKTLDMPENTVYTKLRRTRLKLKEHLTKEGFDYA